MTKLVTFKVKHIEERRESLQTQDDQDVVEVCDGDLEQFLHLPPDRGVVVDPLVVDVVEESLGHLQHRVDVLDLSRVALLGHVDQGDLERQQNIA